jgi:hypothetical protein
MASKDFLNYRINQLRAEVPKVKRKLGHAHQHLSLLDAEIDNLGVKIDSVLDAVTSFELTMDGKYQKTINKLQEKIQKLESQLGNGSSGEIQTNVVVISKAKTIAIFDAVLSSITSWSIHGDQASDIEAASQSIIFPSVYERVMSGGDPAYLLEDVPDSADLVVQRGREYVRWIRSECEGHITTPENWERYAPQIQQWWVNDGLPLLYGEADPDWEHDSPYSLEEIEVWRKNPADRMMIFPQIQDAMDMLQKQRQDVNKTTKLVQFNKTMASTRLS